MKKYFFLLFVSFLFACSSTEKKKDEPKIVEGTFHMDEINCVNERIVETKKGELITGKIYSEDYEIEVRMGKFHGRILGYKNGELIMIGYHSNGERDSLWTYFLDGKITSEFSYNNGKIDGRSKEWKDGVLVSEKTYSNGVLHGPSYTWNAETGQLIKESNYNHDKLEGKQILMSKYGDTLGQANLVNGNGEYRYKDSENEELEYIETYKNGKLDGITKVLKESKTVKETSYKNGIKDGLEITFSTEGKEQSKITYAKGLPDGEYIEYWFNEKKSKEGTYSKGLKTGVWKEYSVDGKVILSSNYKNGKLDGILKKWNYNGSSLILEANYKNGSLDGTLKEWNEYDNKLIKEYTYREGLMDGKSKQFFYGKLISERVYEKGKLTSQTCWDESGKRKKQCYERPNLSSNEYPYDMGPAYSNSTAIAYPVE